MSRHMILRMTEGYKDNYSMSNTVVGATNILLFSCSVTGEYVYDEETAGMIAYNAGIHSGFKRYSSDSSVVTHIQKSSEIFDSSLETVNMSFVGENIDSNIIKMYLKANISLVSLGIDRSVDSNYGYNLTVAEMLLGTIGETGKWENSTVKYCGSKQSVIKILPHEARISDSIKFKLMPQVQSGKLDDIKIHAIEVLHNNLIFVGEDNA